MSNKTITLKTDALLDATAKAVKCSESTALFITSTINIQVKEGKLTLTTTDNVNNMSVIIKNAVSTSDEFFASIPCEIFSKLVSKTTTKEITLTLYDKYLEFIGNGKYNIPLILDEESSLAKIPEIVVAEDKSVTLLKADIESIIQYNKLSVATSLELPQYTGYCVKNSKIYTFNQESACITEVKWKDAELLLSTKIIKLLSVIDDEKVKIYYTDNKIKFVTDTVVISGSLVDGISEFNTEGLDGAVTKDLHPFRVSADISEMSIILDQLSLFIDSSVSGLDPVCFTIEEGKLMISDMELNQCGTVKCVTEGTSDMKQFLVSLSKFKTVLASLSADKINIYLGNDDTVLIAEKKSLITLSQIGLN